MLFFLLLLLFFGCCLASFSASQFSIIFCCALCMLHVAQSIYCSAPSLAIPRRITYAFYWPLAMPSVRQPPPPPPPPPFPSLPPLHRLSHLTLCVYSIAMAFNFLADCLLQKPSDQAICSPSIQPPSASSCSYCIPFVQSVPFMGYSSAQ